MRTNYLLFNLLICIAFVSCGTHVNEEKTLTEDERLTLIYIDSVEKQKRKIADSIRLMEKAKNESERAYLNRPWKLNHFTDAFGDITADEYITTQVIGTFSNSATNNSDLFVEFLFTKTSAGIFLREYNRNSPATKFIGGGKLMLKNSRNETLTILDINDWNQIGGLRIIDMYHEKHKNHRELVNFLKKSNGEVSVVIYDKYSSVYRFKIDATGFIAEFDLL